MVGSELLAQAFEGDEWFRARPGSYDPTASGPSNLGPNNPNLIDTVTSAVDAVRVLEGVGAGTEVPADAVTTSGSNLDPDITPAYARLQAPRVAAARGLEVQAVLDLIDRQTTGRTFGFLGDPGSTCCSSTSRWNA